MPFIQTLTSIIVVAIENKRFSNELLEQEIQKKEMKLMYIEHISYKKIAQVNIEVTDQ